MTIPSQRTGVCPSQLQLIVRCCLLLIVSFLPFSIISPFVNAQETKRILVLHSDWENDIWEQGFDRSYARELRDVRGKDYAIGPHYLGLDRRLSAESRLRLQENIEGVIKEQEIDLVVAVLPDAIDFFNDLPLSTTMPSLLVLPSEQQVSLARPDQAMIVSAWKDAMEQTLEQIMLLRPNTATIEVIVGNSNSDQVYLERLRQVATTYADKLSFNYSVGLLREDLVEKASRLPETSAIFLLPYETFGPNQLPFTTSTLELLTEQSSVPVFGIYDTQFNYGIAGGYVTSIQGYAISAAAKTPALLAGTPVPASASGATSKYSWPVIERWNLDIDRLEGPYEIIGAPSNLIQDYPILSAIGINLIVVLAIALIFQSVLLRRTVAARERIAASEIQAKDSEKKYRLLASNIVDVIWVWQEDSDRLKYCSPSVEHTTGFTPDEYTSMTVRDIMTEDSFKRCEEALSGENSNPTTTEIQLLTKTGSTIWVEFVVRLSIIGEDGRREWTGVSRDISKRRSDEAERRNLEEQVKQVQKFESLGTLAGGIAHDFNNILGVIMGITDVLKADSTDQKNTSRLLSRLMSASEKAQALVQQILTFSRQSKGERKVIELAPLLHDCVDLLHSGKSKNIKLSCSITNDPINILADSNHLEQVIINVMTNALEAVSEPNGKIEIDVTTQKLDSVRKLAHGALAPGNYACICFSDNGIGMTAEEQRKVFDPFYTNKELGNGMGLAIVHGIVIEHGGAIDLQSEANKGSKFSIYLPLSDQEPEAKSCLDDAIKVTDSRRIVVVDDQEDLLIVISEMLGQLGHQCITCSDPREAMNIISKESAQVDLVITDYSMPEISGMEIASYCNQNHPDIPVVLSTGYGDSILEAVGNSSEGNRILNKPFNLATLRQVVEDSVQIEA